MQKSVYVLSIVLIALLTVCCIVWWAVLRESRSGAVTVKFLDVGQGDATYIESPTGMQVLIDGGSTSQVLRQLGKEMPWYDRSIDVLIATHADADHIGGLIDVLARYEVGLILLPHTKGETPVWSAFDTAVRTEPDSKTHIVDRGESIDIGGGALIEVLFPDRALPDVETNLGCVVSRLTYGDTAFMLPCDAPDEIEKYLVLLDGADLKSDVLKAAHHGSKSSSNAWFVSSVAPRYAVFSRGCDNRYGHPAPEVVATFLAMQIPTLDTCIDGTITFESDGQTVTRK